jgi:glycosyltransferase involved in cell wall biosynthesis
LDSQSATQVQSSPQQKHLLHIFPTFAVGGSQMRFAQLVRLHGPRYRHTVIALDRNFDMASRLAGLAVDTLKLQFDKRSVLASWGLFRKTLRDIAPDVLMTYNWGAMEWALVNRFGPAVHHVHIEDGFGPEEAHTQLRRRIWARRLALAGRNTTLVLPSRNLEQIALHLWALPKTRIRYIPNGVDCARFAVPERWQHDGQIVIGTVASLRAEKNIARLLNAFAAIARQREPGALALMIVGDGAERPALETLASSLGVAAQVRFVGQSNQPEKWLAQMDIFALSSDTEQMPLSVLEAMAAGLPIVATAVGDVAQMVAQEGRGAIVPARDADFAQALARLIDDPSAQRLGQANQTKARENFDEGVMAARYAEIIG